MNCNEGVGSEVSQSFRHGLALERVNRERGGLSGHDHESDNGSLGTRNLEPVVETSQRLDKHIDTFIPVFISTGSEEVESVFQVKVEMPVKVTSNEFVNLLFLDSVQVLEFVDSRKLLDVQTVG